MPAMTASYHAERWVSCTAHTFIPVLVLEL